MWTGWTSGEELSYGDYAQCFGSGEQGLCRWWETALLRFGSSDNDGQVLARQRQRQRYDIVLLGRKGAFQKQLNPSLSICPPLLLDKREFWTACGWSHSLCWGEAVVGVAGWLATPPGSKLCHGQVTAVADCSARRCFFPEGHRPSQAPVSDFCMQPSFPLLGQPGLAAMAACSSCSTQLLNANTPFSSVNNYLAGLCYDYTAWSGHDQALPTLARHPLRHLPLLLALAWVTGLLRHKLASFPLGIFYPWFWSHSGCFTSSLLAH